MRDALGVTAAELARRMGIKQHTLTGLEQSEVKGSIRLASLRKAAEAMDCKLYYALVPKGGSLESGLKRRRNLAKIRAEYPAPPAKAAPPPAEPSLRGFTVEKLLEIIRSGGKTGAEPEAAPEERPPGYAQLRDDPEWEG